MRYAKPHLDMQRFEAQFIPEPNSGCWLWIGALHSKAFSYGAFWFRRQRMKAHCAAWLLYRGERNEFFVLHHCDNRLCVNPDHLYLGTHLDNARDRERRKRRYVKGEYNGNAKLTPADVQAIRIDPRSGTEIARSYGVGTTAVYDIKARKKWKHLP